MAEVTPASECSRKLISNFDTKKLLEDVLEILKDEKVFDTTGEFPVVEFSHPHELQVSYFIIYYYYNVNIFFRSGYRVRERNLLRFFFF